MRVSPAAIDDGPLEIRPGEVRVSRRHREGAHIRKMRHAFPIQKPEKLLERSGRVTDGVELSGDHAPRSFLPQLAESLTAV